MYFSHPHVERGGWASDEAWNFNELKISSFLNHYGAKKHFGGNNISIFLRSSIFIFLAIDMSHCVAYFFEAHFRGRLPP
jgi:hypothetical protein